MKISHLTFLFFGIIITFMGNDVFADSHESAGDTTPTTQFTLLIGEHVEPVTHDEYQNWFLHKPFLTFDQKNLTRLENTNYCPQYYRPCSLRLSYRNRAHISKKSYAKIRPQKITDYIEIISDKYNKVPQNAELDAADGKVIVTKKHINGLVLDLEKNTHIVTEALLAKEKQVELSYIESKAKIRTDNITELGLVEIIGEGRSNFAGSTASRIHNIRTAASKFDNLLIAPGETFSFVENLGPVDGTTGYKKELVIKDNKTIPEYGGGVCQVSTTVFRGAIFTGMKINERRNHSYPVKYYEPMGFDATIYLPAPDMKFTNNTDHYIMLDTTIEGTELIFRYYGTKDGRSVVMDGPHVTSRGTDGSAKTYFTQTVVDASGNTIIDDRFSSNYKSPKAYPKVGDASIGKLTSKPSDWSKKQWEAYKKTNGI